MDPLSSSPAAQAFRPSPAALHGDLAAVLRDGRILAGEVLRQEGDGTVLLALGRHRVPAQTQLQLDPGSAFLLRVELTEGGLVLNVISEADGGEPDLLSALRRVVGEGRPIGEMLEAIAARIRAELARPGAAFDELRGLADTLAGRVFQPGQSGEELSTLLQRSGQRYEAALWTALQGGLGADVLGHLSGDLKAELLRLLEALEDGPLKESVKRALAGVEAEQLLNLARQRTGEPSVFSFPLTDGSGWTTARLIVHDQTKQDADAQEQGEHIRRIALGVGFSATGPVRADFLWTKSQLSVRLVAARRELAERLDADHAKLEELFAKSGRTVHLSSRLGSLGEVMLETNPLDIHFLRSHHLMNVAG